MTKYTCKCVRPPSERAVFWEKDGVRYCTSCKGKLIPVVGDVVQDTGGNKSVSAFEAWRDEGEAGA